jgi:hypothetical protein
MRDGKKGNGSAGFFSAAIAVEEHTAIMNTITVFFSTANPFL